MLIDTHCHIHDKEYDFDPEKTLARAHAAKVQKIIVIGTSLKDSIAARDFATAHQGVFYSIGIHPGDLKSITGKPPSTQLKELFTPASQGALGENLPSSFRRHIPPAKAATYIPDGTDRFVSPEIGVGAPNEELETVLPDAQDMTCQTEAGGDEKKLGRFSATNPIAIGEIGLDYHYQPTNREQQIELLEQMLQLSLDLSLPCIFHIREAFPDFWPIISNFNLPPSVLHSFSDSQENLDKAINSGFCIGVNGLATFTKIPLPPLENMVLETDAPYLTPIPFRGKINEPAYIPDIARFIADHFGVTLEKVAEITTQNAERLFNI